MAKCACGNPKCLIKINFDSASKMLLITDKSDNECAFYVDPNTIAEIISKLKEMLNEIINK